MRAVLAGVGAVAAILAIGAAVCAEEIVQAMRDEDVVARVNGTPIHRKAVKEIVQGMVALADNEPDAKTVNRYASDALQSLIGLELLYQESQARGVVVSDDAVKEEIDRIKQRFPNQRSFQEAMKAKGMTENALRLDTRKTMAVNRFLEGIVWKDLQITPAQVREFYDHNRDEFKRPEEVRASHILTRLPEGATAAQRKSAWEKAQALLAKLKEGADFAQLAKQSSQDPGTAEHGGDLGYFARGDMMEDFETFAFALKPGQLSEVVATTYGFHIIKVTDRRPAGVQPVEEVEERIRAVLLKSERQKRQADTVAELRAKAKIESGAPL